jgi:hypothetical protein
MRTALAILWIYLAASVACAGDLESALLGKWRYVSIKSSQGSLPIHEGDYVEFRDGEIRWRWMSEDHLHLYKVKQEGDRNLLIGYLPSAPDKPDVLGIFEFRDGRLVICDREASRGFPAAFSVSEGTLLELVPYEAK